MQLDVIWFIIMSYTDKFGQIQFTKQLLQKIIALHVFFKYFNITFYKKKSTIFNLLKTGLVKKKKKNFQRLEIIL